jgi:iron uptake system EfeUOB component EfeO/EfeM
LLQLLSGGGATPDLLEQIDARYNYLENRISLYRLAEPYDEYSVAETLSHEYLHALLDQLGERRAARTLDLVSRPVRGGARIGGI